MTKLMKNEGRRLVAFATVLFISSSLFTGCSNDSKKNSVVPTPSTAQSTSKVSDTPVTFSIMIKESPTSPFKKDWDFLKELEKRTNVTLDVRPVTTADYIQKSKIVLAAGDTPDIITSVSNQNASIFGANNVLLQLNEYIPKLPNFKKTVVSWKAQDEINKRMVDSNGNMYALPPINEKLLGGEAFFIREDLLKKFNMQIPKTLDDMVTYLKKAKEIGIKLPYSGKWKIWFTRRGFAGIFGLNGGGNDYFYNEKTDSFEYTYATPQFKEMITFMNRLTKEGLFDPETFTQDEKAFEQKFFNGQVALTYHYLGDSLARSLAEIQKVNSEYKLIPMLPPTGTNAPGLAYSGEKLDFGNSVVFPATHKNNPKKLDVLLKFVDWLYYSDEGSLLAQIGVEGVNYKDSGDNYLWLDNRLTPSNPNGILLEKELGYGQINYFAFRRNYKSVSTNMSDAERNFYSDVEKNNRIAPDAPYVSDDPDAVTADKMKMLKSSLLTYSEEYFLRFATNNMDPQKDWDTFVANLKSKGMDEFMKDYNERYKKQKASKKLIYFNK